MKILGLLVALFATTFCAQAQVKVELSLPQDEFLAGEAMPLTVRIVNRSGQTLHFGGSPDWMTFAIESKDGYIITKKGDVPVEDYNLALESSKLGKTDVDLAPYFSFSKPGRYTVTASVMIKEWNQQVSSESKSFDVIVGAKLWDQEIGLPKAANAEDQAPEVRRYTLYQANYLRKRLMLYVQITDINGRVFKVFPIGPMLSFGGPEPQVDRLSNLHVLYQDGQRTYNYTVVDPHGTVLIRQKYDMIDMGPRPKLKINPEGRFEVVGGARRITANDVPPPKPSETNAETAKP
ncbi:MAG TPA: hypothetical protein VK327_10415 [Candidatus Paceibacterota bacterium]|nr:hypothetical protein [Candidatus Paceibacterota bacterium]